MVGGERAERAEISAALAPTRRKTLKRVLITMRSKPLGTVGAFLLIAMVLAAAFANVLENHPPTKVNIPDRYASPSAKYYLGTDPFGRDIYSRILHGARTSLYIGFAVTLLGVTTGAVIGMVTAYLGGTWDMLAQRVMDMLFAFPLFIIALSIVAALGPSISTLIIALSIGVLPRPARVVRSTVLAVKEMQYIDAARVIGAGTARIVFRHVMPNCMAPYIVLATATLGTAILAEAALGFLGLGVPEPYPSWGRMLSGSAFRYAEIAPHIMIFPGLAIALAVFGFNLAGDALRDILDPRLRGA